MDSKKSYLVLARKYRPQTFDEVIGQDPVTTTLKNAVSLNRVGQAYLFTGPRGVGKTSMARIFAKALNCKTGPTIEPCGKCPACLEIESGRSLDVLEIDGASNRGIDEIRELRENVKFAPALGKYKIYIIDEVHQITSEAFNALLKTLEEPPAHVKFIFATTATHKVPATILSRCQRFDFRRITTETIASTLKEICKKEKIKIDEEALFAIAKAADGSLRDSQSILDQIAAASEDKIARSDVIRSLGALEEETLIRLTEALADRDAKAALFVLDEALQEGKDAGLFLEKFLEHTRNLLFVKISEELSSLVDAPESYRKALSKQKERFSKEDLFYFFAVIMHALNTLKRFELKRVPVEMALVKLAQGAPMEDLSKAIEMLRQIEKKNDRAPLAVRAAHNSRPTLKSPMNANTEDEVEIPDVEDLPAEDLVLPAKPKENAVVSLDAVWQLLISALKNEKISVASYLAEGEPLGMEGTVAKISFPERLSFHRESLETLENKKLVEKHLSQLLEMEVAVHYESVKELSGQSGVSAGFKTQTPENPALKSAMSIFGGRIVKN